MLSDTAFFAIGYEESGKRVLTAGGPINKATWLANLQPTPLVPTNSPISTTATTVIVPYQRPAPAAGVALQHGMYVVTTDGAKIVSFLDYVDISDPDGLKYLTFVLGGKDPHAVPEIQPPK